MTHAGYGIKPLTTTRIPGHHIVLAARSTLAGGSGSYTESWRVAATFRTLLDNRDAKPRGSRVHWNPNELWDYIRGVCGTKGLTFLWTHDLSRVARITQLLNILPALGWRLDALSLNPGASWMVFRFKEATLKVVDMQSIWPTTLQRIGQYFELGWTPDLPGEASDTAWLGAVSQDRRIMHTAVMSYLDWLSVNDLGSLTVTGNGQAFTAFRRRFMTDGILTHNDPELTKLERRAMWTGRAEAYWHGSVLRQAVDEWDFSNAYTNIGLEEWVPVFPDRPLRDQADMLEHMDSVSHAALAEVEVITDVPCVPVQIRGHILWPTGGFRTVLWTPEIRRALDVGLSVRLIQGWRYRCAPALGAWSHWLLSQLHADDTAVPAWQKAFLKRWGNVLIGRFGMRYPQWTKIGHSSTSDVYSIPGVDFGTGEEWVLMQVGHEMWQQTGVVAPHYSAPAITGFVMSRMRERLDLLIAEVPRDALLYVDTDSVLVTDRWRSAMGRIACQDEFRGLRLKRTWDGMAIYGPRQLVTGDQVRISGIPKAASRTDRHSFEGEVTESLERALGTRSTGAVRSHTRQWRVEGTDPRRISDGYGWTRPHHVDLLGE